MINQCEVCKGTGMDHFQLNMCPVCNGIGIEKPHANEAIELALIKDFDRIFEVSQ